MSFIVSYHRRKFVCLPWLAIIAVINDCFIQSISNTETGENFPFGANKFTELAQYILRFQRDRMQPCTITQRALGSFCLLSLVIYFLGCLEGCLLKTLIQYSGIKQVVVRLQIDLVTRSESCTSVAHKEQ